MRILLLCVLVAFSTDAAELSEKKAWEWTDEERMAERVDPTSAAYRLALAQTDGREIPIGFTVIVDGDRNPELIMPYELMNAIRAGAFSDDAATRNKWREKWTAAGESLLGQHFWERFESVAGPFIEADANNTRFGTAMNNAPEQERELLRLKRMAANDAVCPSRARALAAARELFGREPFDRFLYEVIAPGMSYLSSPKTPEIAVDMLAWVQGGCQ